MLFLDKIQSLRIVLAVIAERTNEMESYIADARDQGLDLSDYAEKVAEMQQSLNQYVDYRESLLIALKPDVSSSVFEQLCAATHLTSGYVQFSDEFGKVKP